MAITAATVMTSATATMGQKSTVTVTVTNSGTSSVNIIGCVPTCVPTGATPRSTAVALGGPPLLPGQTVAVAGSSGTLALSWDAYAFAPSCGYGLAMPSSQVYDMGAVIYTSDGSITSATTATLTVASPSHT